MVSRWFGKKIAVLMGGASKERDISIRTGLAISSALKKNGYDVVEIEFKLGFESIDIIRNEKPDVAIIAMHGKYGEDGCVQGLLEILRIPYTGGGVMASSVGMDKAVCSSLAAHLGIRCPNREILNYKDAGLRDLVVDIVGRSSVSKLPKAFCSIPFHHQIGLGPHIVERIYIRCLGIPFRSVKTFVLSGSLICCTSRQERS